MNENLKYERRLNFDDSIKSSMKTSLQPPLSNDKSTKTDESNLRRGLSTSQKQGIPGQNLEMLFMRRTMHLVPSCNHRAYLAPLFVENPYPDNEWKQRSEGVRQDNVPINHGFWPTSRLPSILTFLFSLFFCKFPQFLSDSQHSILSLN